MPITIVTNKIKNNLLFNVFITVLFISCNSKSPVITSIDPKIGKMGEYVTLNGKNFGNERDYSYITLAGTSLTGSSYYVWQDDLIMIRIPESGESGLIYVYADGKKSNGVLFTNSDFLPKIIEGQDPGLEPRIISVSPATGAPGNKLIITGINFGNSRDRISASGLNGVFFSWDYEMQSFNPYVVREPEFIEVSEIESGYEFWSSREIHVRIPDGAAKGNMEIRTSHGKSKPFFLDISGKPGSKNYNNKRSYTISYSVDIIVTEASKPNTLYLWISKPVTSPSQQNVKLVSRNAEPFVENHHGVSLFKLENLGVGANQSLSLSYNVQVYSVESSVRPLSIRQDGTNPIHSMYTQSSNLIPCDDPKIKTAVNSIVGREQNPYVKAKMIYDWMLREMKIYQNIPSALNSITEALDQKTADPYNAALLYTAMARAAGLPCIPSAGVLINHNGQTLRHYWTEIWIDNFGWLPVDPAMGARAVPFTYFFTQDSANYYFGNLDNQRIAFSRGEINLSQMGSRGRLVSHTQSYSLQNIWEEASGGLESYTSFWGDILVTGVYVQ